MSASLTVANERPDWPLIGPGDPEPFTVYNPQGKASVLLIADHASRAFPAAMHQLGVADWVLEEHVASDIGSAVVCKTLADRLDAPAVLAGYSRLIVDLNRWPHDPTCFMEVSDGIGIPGNQGLNEHERELRLKSFFRPYHEAVAAQLTALTERGITPALLSIHSCTPVFDRVVRPWQIGVLWDKDPRIAVPLMIRLRASGDIYVGDNEPYSGRHPHDYSIDVHAERAGLPSLGIEVRQDLIADDDGARRWANLLGDSLEPILANKKLYRPLGATDD